MRVFSVDPMDPSGPFNPKAGKGKGNFFAFRPANIFSLLLACFLLTAPPAGAAQYLSQRDAGLYRRAFDLAEEKKFQPALSLAAQARDPTLREVLEALYLGSDESDAGFAAARRFIETHPAWPDSFLKPIAVRAERGMDPDMPPREVLAFFRRRPPRTGDGLNRLIAAYRALGRDGEARDEIRRAWRGRNMGKKEERNFLAAHGGVITPADTIARIDRLLWEGRRGPARRLLKRVPADYRKLVRARLALASGSKSKKTRRRVAAVPRKYRNAPGLVHDRIRAAFKDGNIEKAARLIESTRAPASGRERWWKLRHRAARALLEKGAVRRAYNLARRHNLDSGVAWAEAEFLGGWIALRYLHDPAAAARHFENIYEGARSPITLARAAYWIARAKEAARNGPAARQWYGRALVFGTTYYGQLAAARLYRESRISVPAPPITPAARTRFESSADAARIVQLDQAGQHDLSQAFALALARALSREQDFRLLCNLAISLNRGTMAVRVAKEAARKQILLPGEGYPLLEMPPGIAPARTALLHALIRQESEFDPRAVSRSDARGLMQMLPSTARHVARKNGFADKKPDLFDPVTSIRYGAAYVEELKGDFGGYLPYVIAAYNAGPANVRKWIMRLGDPASGSVDVVDWIESIPFAETRNYVQRVLEGLQIYRARLAGGSTMLALADDLKLP